MSCIQATTTYKPSLGPVLRRHHRRLETVYSASLSSTVYYKSINHTCMKLAYSASNYKRLTPICGISGAGSAASSDDPFSMESLKKAMEGMKQEKPLQDALKEKMQELDFGGDGGAGKRPPRGGGGSGGSASDGPEFKNFNEWLDEVLQVFLATIGLISVYVYIVRGEELVLLARDYIKYLIWGKKSVRLAESTQWWQDRWFDLTDSEKVNMQQLVDIATVLLPSSYYSPNDVPVVIDDSMVNEAESDGEETEDGEDDREGSNQVRERGIFDEDDNEKSDDEDSYDF